MKRRIHLLNCLAAALLFSGCMGYNLGNPQIEGVHSVAIAPVINKTEEPSMELQVTRALREQLQFDGRLTLKNTREEADAAITVTLTEFNLYPIAFRTDLPTTALQYRMRVEAVAVLTDTRTGKVRSTSTSYGEATFIFESDMTNSKRDAMPRAARDLAHYMVDDLIEQW